VERKQVLKKQKNEIEILEKEIEAQDFLRELGINDYIVYFDRKLNKLVAVKK
jgi:hypothetical protein